ncbi:Hemerythrin HHE cation binding domain-containing protein [Arenibacter nanhaiticus]|uniref:Hemerythrin HHE cation binding domain-containing protein n=1 Tax=Arenibacter nanhaiticus TaxID=558155 RepID=A0A1M6GY14_9FLAO|nr:hemerythrin domain-containing protein [Arenibacter nanhaiticus]SHJ14868.1 Hemerythrin HHE cation binding domain-containing protein [Arenibacter nanhaiticus]
MKTKPIKRHISLQPISHDHHHSLLLCWKIRTGISKGMDPLRIKRYADWFFEHHIQPHFILEENLIFPILGDQHVLIKKALHDHKRLRSLFKNTGDMGTTIRSIEKVLTSHIRFEERILFYEIQNLATEEQLQWISMAHTAEKFRENTADTFWE